MSKPKVKFVKFSQAEMDYDLPDELDFLKLIPIIGRGIHADEMHGAKPLIVKYAVVDDSFVSLTLADGRKVSAPLSWYPRLQHGSPSERNDWRLAMGGRVVMWRSLKIGIAAKALIEGTKANESASSIKQWLSERKVNDRKRKAG